MTILKLIELNLNFKFKNGEDRNDVHSSGRIREWSTPQNRSRRPEVFLRKGFLKICSKFKKELPCRSVISIKLQSDFIEIVLRHGCSPVNLLHIFRIPFLKNTSGRLLISKIYHGLPLFELYVNLLCKAQRFGRDLSIFWFGRNPGFWSPKLAPKFKKCHFPP